MITSRRDSLAGILGAIIFSLLDISVLEPIGSETGILVEERIYAMGTICLVKYQKILA